MINFIKSLFSVFKAGNPAGNLPSPRYDEIDLATVIKSTVQNSNSMEPLIDIGHTILLDTYYHQDDVLEGDVIIYNDGVRDIIHSVIGVSFDGEWYCRAQGLNNNRPDIGKIRFPQIRYMCVGVLWTNKFANYIPEEGD